MAGCRSLKLVFLLSVLAAIASGADARALCKSTRGARSVSDWIARLDARLSIFDSDANTARGSYYDNRIKPWHPVITQNLTRTVHLNGSETAEDIIRRFIQETDRFRNPLYLAYFDEHSRGDTLVDVSYKLLDASSTLNLTYYWASNYVFQVMFPKKSLPSANLRWTRVYMENILKGQKNISLWPTLTLHELRTYVTLRELQNTQNELRKLLLQLKKFV